MSAERMFQLLLPAWFALSALACVAVMFISAPYGRHNRAGWGPQVPARLGWILMESPAVVIPLLVMYEHSAWTDAGAMVLMSMWLLHYLHRALWWPVTSVSRSAKMPLVVCALAFITNIGIDWLNAEWVCHRGRPWGLSWLKDQRFIIGASMFLIGMAINRSSDATLRGLRAPGETGYKIPRGGLYRWISSPNYLGEIIEWLGWAVATWSLAGVAFALWTIANLAPRAATNHRWYHERFDNYPPERKALIPGVW